MAQEYGFFNSTSYETQDGIPVGDKAKDATFFARFFSSFIRNGVFAGGFELSIASGMTVSVAPGQCWINGYFAYNDESESKTFETGSASHEYWLIQRLNTVDGELSAMWITDPASDYLPVREESIYDLVLYKVAIPAGASALTMSMITDYRDNQDMCGAVTGINDGLSEEIITPAWISNVTRLTGGIYTATSNSANNANEKTAEINDDTFLSYRVGMLIALYLTNGNTAAAPTLNINSFGAKPIVFGGGINLDAAWPNGVALLEYNGSAFELLNGEAGYIPKSGGQMSGQLKAQPNTDYTAYQVRNIALSTTASLPIGEGSILGVYE